jgi:3-phosphoshikimate 1-carboxyvinyltransferase
MGAVRVLKRMGANIRVSGFRSQVSGGEPMGDIVVKSSQLKGTKVRHREVPSLIDELPVLMVAASLARGKTVFQGVEELRVKETDRIASMKENLGKMGAKISVLKKNGREDVLIRGVKELAGANLRSFGDHRTAMSAIIAGLTAKGSTRIDDVSCINKSFPDFIDILKALVV